MKTFNPAVLRGQVFIASQLYPEMQKKANFRGLLFGSNLPIIQSKLLKRIFEGGCANFSYIFFKEKFIHNSTKIMNYVFGGLCTNFRGLLFGSNLLII